MGLQLVVDKLDGVPENFRELYTEKDGKFHLSVDGIEDTGPLKRALEAERTRAKALEVQAAAWKRMGKTPDEIEALVEAARIAEENKLTQAGEWDKLKAQMNAKHDEALKGLKTQLDVKDGEIKSMRGTLESHLVDMTATAAIAAAKGVPELLLPQVQKFVRVVEQDGRYSTKVVDGKGDPRFNARGEPLTVEDLIAEMKVNEVYGRAFEGSGNSGSGMRPNNGGGGSAHGINKRSEFKTEQERANFVDEHGLEAYQALPA